MYVPVIYPIHGVYPKESRADVSVIVPLHKSKAAVREQIMRWTQDDNLKVEIVYVDDKCPQKSGWAVHNYWNKRRDKSKFLVKIVMSPFNMGFARACNLGAHHATGRHLIFLNADTTVTPNWLSPLLEQLDRPEVGIVGNLQLKEGGDLHGTVDSCGSEWCWEQVNFMHIGRNIYEGELLERPFTLDNIPAELLQVSEREMVTGCCLGIKRDVFHNLGGFNANYRIGYWEDSELCLRTRELGYKIVYQPESVIFHKLHGSNVQRHVHQDENGLYFFQKWVETGRIDALVKSPRNLHPTKPTNILVKRRSAYGDVLVAAAVLPALKKRYPDAKLYFLSDPNCAAVLKNNPYIHQILMDKDLKGLTFQRLYNLDYAYEIRPNVNILQAYADECGVPLQDCELFIDTQPVNDLPEKYVAFHVAKTAWVGRNWTTEGFQVIADRVKNAGYEVVCVGSKGEGVLEGSLDLRQKLTVQQLATVMRNAKAFVGADSFPMHVAQAVKTPGVCFFGAILPEHRIISENMKGVNVSGLPCLGCHHRKFAPVTSNDSCATRTLACENQFTADMMWNKLQEILWDQNA